MIAVRFLQHNSLSSPSFDKMLLFPSLNFSSFFQQEEEEREKKRIEEEKRRIEEEERLAVLAKARELEEQRRLEEEEQMRKVWNMLLSKLRKEMAQLDEK